MYWSKKLFFLHWKKRYICLDIYADTCEPCLFFHGLRAFWTLTWGSLKQPTFMLNYEQQSSSKNSLINNTWITLNRNCNFKTLLRDKKCNRPAVPNKPGSAQVAVYQMSESRVLGKRNTQLQYSFKGFHHLRFDRPWWLLFFLWPHNRFICNRPKKRRLGNLATYSRNNHGNADANGGGWIHFPPRFFSVFHANKFIFIYQSLRSRWGLITRRRPVSGEMQMAWQMAAGYVSFPDTADICTVQPSGPSLLLLLHLQFNEHVFMGDAAMCWFRTIRSS